MSLIIIESKYKNSRNRNASPERTYSIQGQIEKSPGISGILIHAYMTLTNF